MHHVVILGGGQWQMPIIKHFKRSGFMVCVVNPERTDATYDSSWHIDEDIYNIPRIADRLMGNAKFVISDQSDIAMLPVTELSYALGTICNDINSVLLFTNKIAMSNFAKDIGVPVPDFASADTTLKVEDFVNKNGLPAVIKPVDANASRGFSKLDSLNNIPIKFRKAMSYSRIKKTIIQKYVKGRLLVLDGICDSNKHKTLMHGMSQTFRDGIISQVDYPSDFPEKLLEKVIGLNNLYVEKSGLSFGITHAEWMVDGDDFFLLDIACRGGGFGISSDVIPWVTGVSVYNILTESLQSRKTDIYAIKPTQKFARLKFFEYKSGKVVDIEGVNKARESVRDFRMYLKKGEECKPAVDGGTRHAFLLTFGRNKDELDEQVRKVENLVKVIVE